MIIKSHVRGGYRAAADYLKDQGKNEEIRLVEISDPDAKNLDQAFHNMWEVASSTRVRKAMHHISFNPLKGERLTDEQMLKIVKRAEEKYGYKEGDHQRVIVEHIKDGRQHFHVMWNRVSLRTGRPVWPGMHWSKSKQTCREMEKELGLKSPVFRRSRETSHTFLKTFPWASRHNSRASTRTSDSYKYTPSLPWRVPSALMLQRYQQSIAHLPITPPARLTNVQDPIRPEPTRNAKGWPVEARIDWEMWGRANPPLFWAKWPDLAPQGFQGGCSGPSR